MQRGWGRPSTPADYYYDDPILLGTCARPGILFNIGRRQPSKTWQLNSSLPTARRRAGQHHARLFRTCSGDGESRKAWSRCLPEQYQVQGMWCRPRKHWDLVDLPGLSQSYLPDTPGDANATQERPAILA